MSVLKETHELLEALKMRAFELTRTPVSEVYLKQLRDELKQLVNNYGEPGN